MTVNQYALQDREIVSSMTARQLHLNAIEHLEQALAFHKAAVSNHDQGDLAMAGQNTRQALVHVEHAGEQTSCATKHYCEQRFYK